MTLVAQGKVRDIFDAGQDRLLLVATDRISAFDVILPTPIPDKGRVLTACSLFWFHRLESVVPNHLISGDRGLFPPPYDEDPDLAGRATLARAADVIPMECVVRGYLAGSGWKQYREYGSVCGIRLPLDMQESAKLPQPIFTPTTKAAEGHDEPLTPAEARELVGTGLYERLREVSIALFQRITQRAFGAGVIVADTKFEFGFDRETKELTLIDEVGTPDSSRFWPVEGYEPGRPQPSFDKQYVRDWLDATGWDHEAPPPALPEHVVEATAERYREAYERISGETFDTYRARMGVAS